MNRISRIAGPAWSWLEPLGFRQRPDGLGFQHNGVLLQPEHRWIVLQTSAEASDAPLVAPLGMPGLWKPCGNGRPSREFQLPLAALGAGGLDEDGTATLQTCVEWALATSHGALPVGWTSPPLDQVQQWIPESGLTIQSGPFGRQGELVHAPDRLGIRFPIVPAVAQSLAGSRRAWLDRLLIDALCRWRLVRVGWSGPAERRSIDAEVDLSGAPHEVLEHLVPIVVDALRCVVERLLWPANLLADIRVECRLVDVIPSG